MPYTRTTWADYPNTTTPITATALNNIEQGIVTLDRYNGVYTNEAARDAAITSPAEGMTAYLTAPTVPAATGATTMVPTGITTIYNGSAWVCTTEVGAITNASGTTTSSAAWTATLSGSPGTNPSVTLATGTTALVYLTGTVANSGANICNIGVAVSGATTIAASADYCLEAVTTNNLSFGKVMPITGLTAGTNTFTLHYLVSAGTGTFQRRQLVVKGIA